jgi:hypothetical protein
MISATSIGSTAWDVMTSAHAAKVVGITSRGLFLLAPAQRIVFVSSERYRSPLTINIAGSLERLRDLEIGASAQFSDSRLIFPLIELSLSLPADAVWHCPLPPSAACPRMEQWQILRAIAGGVLAQQCGDGLAAVLPKLPDLPDASPHSVGPSALLDQLIMLRRAVQAGDSQTAIAGLIRLLGQGRGLTPSGDDVVIGLLLVLARSRRLTSVTDGVAASIVNEASQRTTAISANLIECAADGQGDERLITVVDGIATGSASIDECVDCVLDWGSSSGLDALVGMAIAV